MSRSVIKNNLTRTIKKFLLGFCSENYLSEFNVTGVKKRGIPQKKSFEKVFPKTFKLLIGTISCPTFLNAYKEFVFPSFLTS